MKEERRKKERKGGLWWDGRLNTIKKYLSIDKEVRENNENGGCTCRWERGVNIEWCYMKTLNDQVEVEVRVRKDDARKMFKNKLGDRR